MTTDNDSETNVAEGETPVESPTPATQTPSEPVAAEPVAAEPVAAEPVAAEPVAAEPVAETAAPVEAQADAPSASEGDDAEGDEGGEGEGSEGEPEGDAAVAADGTATGDKPKRKRRRRRKKKAPGEAGTTEAGAAPAEGAPEEPGSEGGERRRRPEIRDAREAMPFRIGEEVFGKVEKVTEHAIWIDVAGKALGIFDRRELGEIEPPTEGDQFIATVASHGIRGGLLRMARAPFVLEDAKKKVEEAKDSGAELEGFVTGAVRGGIEVDIDGMRAFAPASHVDLRPGADLSHLVGQRLNFIIVQYEKKGRDVVVSRKKFLSEEAHKAREEALKSIEIGSVHEGVVRNIVQWGVFVALPSLNNIEGLIHATEASHDRIAKLGDLFAPGDKVEVKILKVDDKGKLWLSRKSMTNDPWDAGKEKYKVGSRHMGKVVRLQPFGAFVELEPGIDGLCYSGDLSFKQVTHPKDIVKVGDELEFVIATCDSSSRKISLHAAPPADEADEPRPKVGPHRIVKVAVVQPTEAGLVVRVIGLSGRAARGFIPAGHTGTQRGTDLRKEFPINAKFDAKVIEVDTRRGEIKLSIRALKEDTEKQAYQEYRDTVAREAKFGTFGDLMKKTLGGS